MRQCAPSDSQHWLALLLPLVYLLKLLKDLVAQLIHLRWWHLLGDGDGRWCPAHKVVYLMLHRNADQARDKSSRRPFSCGA